MKVSAIERRFGVNRILPGTLKLVFVLLVVNAAQAQADSSGTMGVAQDQGFAALETLDSAELEQTRAREEAIINFNTVKSIQKMQSSVSETSFGIGGDMVSGNVSFAEGALGNYSGTGIFNAVTGSANSVNNAVGISVFISN